jgi:hypothetical protein
MIGSTNSSPRITAAEQTCSTGSGLNGILAFLLLVFVVDRTNDLYANEDDIAIDRRRNLAKSSNHSLVFQFAKWRDDCSVKNIRVSADLGARPNAFTIKYALENRLSVGGRHRVDRTPRGRQQSITFCVRNIPILWPPVVGNPSSAVRATPPKYPSTRDIIICS